MLCNCPRVVCSRCCHLCIPSVIAVILARPACPCRSCRRRSALRASLRMTTTKTTPWASLIFWRAEHHNINCTMMSLLCLSSLIVYVIVVAGVILQKCPSQSWRSTTSKKSHILALPSSSFVTLLPLSPSQSSHPINRNVINCGHRHCCGCRTPHRRHRGARRCHDNRVEEDPVCQTEDGLVQAVSGVGTVTSVVILLLRRLCRRRRRR